MFGLAALPSASAALVVGRSVSRGLSHGAAVAAGIVCGDLLFLVLVLLGLTALASTMGAAFSIIKYLGAAYLLWLGWRFLVSEVTTAIKVEPDQNIGGLAISYASGLLLTLGDIKAIFFYLSLLPMFVDLASLRVVDAWVIVAVTVASVGSAKLFYAVMARRLVESASSERMLLLSRRGAGAALLGAGGYVVLKP